MLMDKNIHKYLFFLNAEKLNITVTFYVLDFIEP